jgi:hypothetical protein
MSGRSKWIVGLSAILLLTAAARAQEPAPDAAPAPRSGPMRGPGFGLGPFGDRMELLGFGGMRGGKVVTGAPFSAVATGESKQILADGTTISHKVQTNLFRDAQGRFRKEVTMPAVGPLAASGAPRSFVVIQDPVAGASFVLEPDRKVARKMPQRDKSDPEADAAKGPQHQRMNPDDDPNVKKEPLGTQVINGISAQGTRYTRTIPVGQIGNDKPVTIVREEWYSPDLQVVVQSKHSDPFGGDTTYVLTNIQRSAPNASLFSVPSDYTVKDSWKPGMAGKHRGHRPGEAPPPPADGSDPGM